jgi:hypothetical protein
MGPYGHQGGAFSMHSTKTVTAGSVPAGELEALDDALKEVVKFRILAEEVAGCRPDHTDSEFTVEKSPPPSVLVAPREVVRDCQNADGGIWDSPPRETAVRRHLAQHCPGATQRDAGHPPTVLCGDNEAIIARVATGMGTVRGLQAHVRKSNNVYMHKAAGTIAPTFVESPDNAADGLTKLQRCMVTHLAGLEQLLGPSPLLTRIRRDAQAQYGRKDRALFSTTRVEALPGVDILDVAPWLRYSTKAQPAVRAGMRSLNAPHEPALRTLMGQNQGDRAGLGYVAPSLQLLQPTEPGAAALPDPDADPDGWAALTLHNTQKNTSGAHILTAIQNGSIDQRVAISWAQSEADLGLAEADHAWAVQRQQQRALNGCADARAVATQPHAHMAPSDDESNRQWTGRRQRSRQGQNRRQQEKERRWQQKISDRTSEMG